MKRSLLKVWFGGALALLSFLNSAFGWFRSFDWLQKNATPAWNVLVSPQTTYTLIFLALILSGTGLWEFWQLKRKPNQDSVQMEAHERSGQDISHSPVGGGITQVDGNSSGPIMSVQSGSNVYAPGGTVTVNHPPAITSAPKRVDNSNPYYGIDPFTLTLHDLFMRDFIGQKFGATWKIGEPRDIPESFIKFMVVIDLLARSRFLEFYISLSRDTYKLCELIAEVYMQAVEYPEKQCGVMRLDPSPGQTRGASSDEAVFTGAVFIYYEGRIASEQFLLLERLYESKNLRVSFRGPEYLASKKSDLMPPPNKLITGA